MEAIRAEMTKEGFLIHRRGELGKEEQINCIEIRGAVVGPTVSHPGYYLLFGKKREADGEGKHLIFLTEGEDGLQESLFTKLKEDLKSFYCHALYTGYSIKKPSEFSFDLHKALRGLEVNLYPSLPLPLKSEDIRDGIVLIREWSKYLDIPRGTMLGSQLGDIQLENLDECFYAVNALRFLIGGFKRDPSARLVNRFREKIEEREKKDTRGKLDTLSRIAWAELDRFKEEKELEYEYEQTGELW